jgi:hypothetical protein
MSFSCISSVEPPTKKEKKKENCFHKYSWERTPVPARKALQSIGSVA